MRRILPALEEIILAERSGGFAGRLRNPITALRSFPAASIPE
ncbi:MAG TPA: hypothetical protein VFU55_01150 [Terracidiphilus sp.]|nr:hypothetical protein [Terracidiphilus sp.]